MTRHFSARYIVTLALLYAFGMQSTLVCAAQAPVIEVLYPEVEGPYQKVFSAIIEGIQAQSKVEVRLLSITDGLDIPQIIKSANIKNVSAIIALGKSGLIAAEHWRGKVPIVVGALLLTPDKNERGLAGISLAADPDLLLERLTYLAPSIKRVHVVYSPRSSEWLVKIADKVAGQFNLQLRSYKSEDIKSTALIYRDILNTSHPGEDAIWVLPDPVAIDNKITFPLLLRGAWDNNILLFSNNPSLVKRGALFALFPDNKLMGRSLAKMAESYIGDDAANMKNAVVPLRDLLAAINVRTADHIGLRLSNEERKDYALIFPAP